MPLVRQIKWAIIAAFLIAVCAAAPAADKGVEKPVKPAPAPAPPTKAPEKPAEKPAEKKPVKTYENFSDLMAGLPESAGPGDTGWDKFNADKTDAWLKANIVGSKLKVAAPLRTVSVIRNRSPKPGEGEWRISITLDAPETFDFHNTTVSPHLSGSFFITASEQAARDAEQIAKGTAITIEGTITLARLANPKDKKAGLTVTVNPYTLTGLTGAPK